MATRFFATAQPNAFTNPFVDIVTLRFGLPDLITRIYALNSVDYGFSTSAVFIDLERNPQRGGFAEGDTLVEFGDVRGTGSSDIIRGSDLIPDRFASGVPVFTVINNPGSNKFEGFGGNDILEGRGGGDILDGGSGSDTASYETSPSAVFVTVNEPSTAAFVASGGDANGDQLFSI